LSFQEHIQSTNQGTIVFLDEHPLLLYGMNEFQSWFHHLDSFAEIPLHRKLLYAATDSYEQLKCFGIKKPNVLFGQKKFSSELIAQWQALGWGNFSPKNMTIMSSVHSELTTGFSLAIMEFLKGQRLKIEHFQEQEHIIRISTEPSGRQMIPVPVVQRFDWEFDEQPVEFENLGFEIDQRNVGWYVDDQRSFFLPVEAFRQFYHSLLSVNFSSKHRRNELIDIQGIQSQQIHVFRTALLSSAITEFESNVPCFVQSEYDWKNILALTKTTRGFGLSQILDFDVQRKSTSLTVKGFNAPYIIGKIWSKWDKAIGESSKCTVKVGKNEILVDFCPLS
jgi:hypothetical protein